MARHGADVLRRYLTFHEMSANRFAQKAGIDPSQLYKVLRGERSTVTLDEAAKIERASEGFVEIKSWVEERTK